MLKQNPYLKTPLDREKFISPIPVLNKDKRDEKMRFQTIFAAFALTAEPVLALGAQQAAEFDEFSNLGPAFQQYLAAVMNRPKRGMAGAMYRGGYF
ncbi:Oidioi.mRNA.OKI2018_I69.chr1.g3754.t1.cds [Oikopleura dioica]|uniref:Oidioi.mRNA.OKI2018_I69.chr1.g3754.t1.cds n=1 Tax=Oikopleura dioica TaxID=34765 RepID=A0ABN7SV68_OIKDI|nr:Oidioi.mRNA.OKI2018_I69.chr1.g3754.t1.cds [Oikopleura dioica]